MTTKLQQQQQAARDRVLARLARQAGGDFQIGPVQLGRLIAEELEQDRRRRGGRAAAAAREKNAGRDDWRTRARRIYSRMDEDRPRKECAAIIADKLALSETTVYKALPPRRPR